MLLMTVKVRKQALFPLIKFSFQFNFAACGPPTVSVAVEYSTYTVSEDIRHNHYALQVCAVTTGALIPVDLAINPVNGTALGKCTNLYIRENCIRCH